MASLQFDELVSYLQNRYGDDLRWVANYNSRTYEYKVRHIRKDLKSDLKGIELDHLIHRSLAVYNKRHAEQVYFHLGEADSLISSYDRGTALHVFLDDRRGVTVMIEPDVELRLPRDLTEWRRVLEAE